MRLELKMETKPRHRNSDENETRFRFYASNELAAAFRIECSKLDQPVGRVINMLLREFMTDPDTAIERLKSKGIFKCTK